MKYKQFTTEEDIDNIKKIDIFLEKWETIFDEKVKEKFNTEKETRFYGWFIYPRPKARSSGMHDSWIKPSINLGDTWNLKSYYDCFCDCRPMHVYFKEITEEVTPPPEILNLFTKYDFYFSLELYVKRTKEDQKLVDGILTQLKSIVTPDIDPYYRKGGELDATVYSLVCRRPGTGTVADGGFYTSNEEAIRSVLKRNTRSFKTDEEVEGGVKYYKNRLGDKESGVYKPDNVIDYGNTKEIIEGITLHMNEIKKLMHKLK